MKQNALNPVKRNLPYLYIHHNKDKKVTRQLSLSSVVCYLSYPAFKWQFKMAITKESIFLGALLLFLKNIPDFCSEIKRRYISELKGWITRLSTEFLHYRVMVDTHVLRQIHFFSFVIPSNVTGKDKTLQF